MNSRWGGGGGGAPLYKLYRYVLPHRVGCLCCFGLKTGIYFAYFGLESGMVFEGTMGAYEVRRARAIKYKPQGIY